MRKAFVAFGLIFCGGVVNGAGASSVSWLYSAALVSDAQGKQTSPAKQLREAIFAKDLGRVKSLSISKDVVNSMTDSGVTPLMIAASIGNLDMVRILADAGAELDYRTNESKISALMFAAAFGHYDVAQFLVNRRATLDSRDASGNTALEYAMLTFGPEDNVDKEGRQKCILLLVSKGLRLTTSSNESPVGDSSNEYPKESTETNNRGQ